jgi:hypothetical protein
VGGGVIIGLSPFVLLLEQEIISRVIKDKNNILSFFMINF